MKIWINKRHFLQSFYLSWCQIDVVLCHAVWFLGWCQIDRQSIANWSQKNVKIRPCLCCHISIQDEQTWQSYPFVLCLHGFVQLCHLADWDRDIQVVLHSQCTCSTRPKISIVFFEVWWHDCDNGKYTDIYGEHNGLCWCWCWCWCCCCCCCCCGCCCCCCCCWMMMMMMNHRSWIMDHDDNDFDDSWWFMSWWLLWVKIDMLRIWFGYLAIWPGWATHDNGVNIIKRALPHVDWWLLVANTRQQNAAKALCKLQTNWHFVNRVVTNGLASIG